MSFGAPQWFWALLAIPFLAIVFARAERRAVVRLREFVSERLLPDLARTVDRRRRKLRFALVLLGIGFLITALAEPRWGYIYEDVKRKGLDLIFAADTSRSMLSNDVPPSRLQRVKLAMQDLLNELQGDRVGLVAFAGRAFLQAPLTIDYSAAVEAVNDLDTNTIPEGGTNISAAIDLAVGTFGKSAIGNRAMIVFTDGEELSGDGIKTAKLAADAGVRIFTVGVGTPEGSLIPINGAGGGSAFVKGGNGQVVKSKLDEKRLKEIAEATGGLYLHLDDGPRTMKALFSEGLAKMQTGEIDDRMSRRPIERYQWPLAAGLVALTLSYLMRERKRVRVPSVSRRETKRALAVATALLLMFAGTSLAAAPGLDAYRNDKYSEAYQEFEKTLKEHPNTHAADKIEFDAGAAAYKMGDYNKALEWFSRSLLSKDKTLQEKSHYNIGRTLEERADRAQTNEKALGDLSDAQSHYEEALKIDPKDERAQANLDEVKKKIERLKQSPPKKPSPPPQSQKDKQQQKEQPKDQQKQDQQQKDEQKKQDQQDQKDRQEKSDDKNKKDEPKPGETPSPSPGGEQQQQQQNQASPSPSASSGQNKGEDQKEEQKSPSNGDENASPSPSASASASPSPGDSESPSPSPGAGDEAQPSASPSASASASPQKKLSGDVKGAGEEKPNQAPQSAEVAPAEPEKEGQMSEKQAQLLLQSMKDEEQRVQLDERKAARHVYKDW
jgi:Ca-activated chloride channel family protein